MHKIEDLGAKYQTRVLKNGSRIFLFERKGAPIYIRATVDAGSRRDTIPGIAHALEHMLVSGTEKYPNKSKLAEKIESIGGMFNATTSKDTLNFNYQVADKEDLPVMTELFHEMFYKSLFKSEVLEKEKGAILSEINVKEMAPARHVVDMLWNDAFRGTSYEHDILGTKETVQSFSIEQIKDFHQKVVLSSPVTFIVSGDIGIDALENKLGLAMSDERLENLEEEDLIVLNGDSISKKEINGEVSYLYIGFRTDTKNMKERVAISLFNSIMSSGRTSVLTNKLRYEKGLVYGVRGMSKHSHGIGLFGLQTACKKENLEEVLNIIENGMNSAFDGDIIKNRLSFVKNKRIKSTHIKLQSSEQWVQWHSRFMYFDQPDILLASDWMNIVETITDEDLKDVVSKHIKKDRKFTAIISA